MAPNHLENPYCPNPKVQDDGSVTFECLLDVEANPWLALPPHHPVVIQTQSFWTAVTGSIALQGMKPTQWSALTWIDWELGTSAGGHAFRGEYRSTREGDNPHYAIVLFNASDQIVVSIKGRGVIFRNRNFEEWREGSKAEARSASAPVSFDYATHDELALIDGENVLVAPFDAAKGYIDALVTKENGFAPRNAYIGGSGDHVNSTHFHEVARQALLLITERTNIDTSGEMTLNRYVELGVPLRLMIKSQGQDCITFELQQLGRKCAEITLRW